MHCVLLCCTLCTYTRPAPALFIPEGDAVDDARISCTVRAFLLEIQPFMGRNKGITGQKPMVHSCLWIRVLLQPRPTQCNLFWVADALFLLKARPAFLADGMGFWHAGEFSPSSFYFYLVLFVSWYLVATDTPFEHAPLIE